MLIDSAQLYTDFEGLSALRAKAREDQDAAIDQVVRQFESLFLQMMLKSMRDASFGGGLLDADRTIAQPLQHLPPVEQGAQQRHLLSQPVRSEAMQRSGFQLDPGPASVGQDALHFDANARLQLFEQLMKTYSDRPWIQRKCHIFHLFFLNLHNFVVPCTEADHLTRINLGLLA